MKQDYELMLVLNPALSAEEDEAARALVREAITGNGGTIFAEDRWGANPRRLAYSIKKAGQTYMEGVYYLYKFNLEPDLVSTVQRPMLLSEQTLRHMITRTDPPEEVEEPAQQPVVEEVAAPASPQGAVSPQESGAGG